MAEGFGRVGKASEHLVRARQHDPALVIVRVGLEPLGKPLEHAIDFLRGLFFLRLCNGLLVQRLRLAQPQIAHHGRDGQDQAQGDDGAWAFPCV